MSTNGCCRGLPAQVCAARPYGCSDEPPPKAAPRRESAPQDGETADLVKRLREPVKHYRGGTVMAEYPDALRVEAAALIERLAAGRGENITAHELSIDLGVEFDDDATFDEMAAFLLEKFDIRKSAQTGDTSK